MTEQLKKPVCDKKVINIRVLLFASLRDLFKKSELELSVEQGTTLQGLRDKAFADIDRKEERWKSLFCAVDQNYATLDTELKDGDEVAFLPPVAGG